MRYCTVSSQIKVPPILLFIQLALLHPFLEDFKDLFSLAATNNLADLRHERVEGSYGFPVGVQLHVEGLDFLRIVVKENGSVVDFLSEVLFVLSGQVHAPRDFALVVLELHA